MLKEAGLLKLSIRQLLRYEGGRELSAYDVWAVSSGLYRWQQEFDPLGELFPLPPGGNHDFDTFKEKFWDEVETHKPYFTDNVERAFNTCLAKIAVNTKSDADALQILFVIHPNLILEKFAFQDDAILDFYFEDDEVDVLHDLMVSRLETPKHRLTTLSFLRQAATQLKKKGLDFYPHFKKLEKRLQDSIVLKTPKGERIISSEDRAAPDLVVLDGGLDE